MISPELQQALIEPPTPRSLRMIRETLRATVPDLCAVTGYRTLRSWHMLESGGAIPVWRWNLLRSAILEDRIAPRASPKRRKAPRPQYDAIRWLNVAEKQKLIEAVKGAANAAGISMCELANAAGICPATLQKIYNSGGGSLLTAARTSDLVAILFDSLSDIKEAHCSVQKSAQSVRDLCEFRVSLGMSQREIGAEIIMSTTSRRPGAVVSMMETGAMPFTQKRKTAYISALNERFLKIITHPAWEILNSYKEGLNK